MDDQLFGLRVATPAGVEPGIGGSMTLVMAMSPSRHVCMLVQIRP